MSRRKPTGATHPILAAYLNALPTAGTVWSYADRRRWLNGVQAAFNLIYTDDTSRPPSVRGGFDVEITGSDSADDPSDPEMLTD